MSRKKLKGFDPGNNNKARRSAYQALQDGGSLYNQAPRAHSDSNRLTGAARRFATQVLISKRLDQRDREVQRAREGKITSGQATNFMPDYKQALQAQIQASAERAAKKALKEERRRLAKEGGGGGAEAAAASAPASTAAASSSVAMSAQSGGAAFTLSKSVEQQRQAKAERMAEEEKRSVDAQRKAAAAAAAAESAAATAAAEAAARAAADAPSEGAAAAAVGKVTFSTEMRAGESFRSYQARLVREKAEKMQGEVKGKKISEKKKRKLAEREERRKVKKDPSIDPREARVQAERAEKDAKDAARAAKLRGNRTASNDADADADADAESSARSAKRARTGTATEFASAAPVSFGDVVERPPTLAVVPKSKALPAGKISHERIIDSLLLMQEGKAKRRGGLKGMDEHEKSEWIAKQRDQLRRADAAEKAKAEALESLREQSVAAYKAAKLKRKAEDASASKDSEEPNKPYVKKSILKKQRRNRERMQQFKDNAELDLEMEIEAEAISGFDD